MQLDVFNALSFWQLVWMMLIRWSLALFRLESLIVENLRGQDRIPESLQLADLAEDEGVLTTEVSGILGVDFDQSAGQPISLVDLMILIPPIIRLNLLLLESLFRQRRWLNLLFNCFENLVHRSATTREKMMQFISSLRTLLMLYQVL